MYPLLSTQLEELGPLLPSDERKSLTVEPHIFGSIYFVGEVQWLNHPSVLSSLNLYCNYKRFALVNTLPNIKLLSISSH